MKRFFLSIIVFYSLCKTYTQVEQNGRNECVAGHRLLLRHNVRRHARSARIHVKITYVKKYFTWAFVGNGRVVFRMYTRLVVRPNTPKIILLLLVNNFILMRFIGEFACKSGAESPLRRSGVECDVIYN